MNFCDNKVCGRKSEESEKNTMLQQEDLIPKQEEAADVLKSKTLRRTSYASFLFSIALEVLLVAVVTTLMIIIWFFASKHAQHSVAVVSNNLRGEWLTYAKASTTSVLERNNASATHLANLMVSSLMKGNLSSYSTLEEQVKPALFLVYSTNPYATQVFFMGKNGFLISYYSDLIKTVILFANTTNNSKSNVLASTNQGYLWYRQSTTVSTGQPIGEAIPTDAYAFWGTKWFQDALYSEHGLTTWGLAFGQSKELLFLSLASVKDSSNANPFGVVALGVPMSSLANIIVQFDLQGVDMYLATEDGYLLAQTGSILEVEGDLDKPILLEATKSSNVVVAGAALYLKSKLENISRLGNETFSFSDARIQGAKYIVDSAPLHFDGKSLVFVLIIPHKSIWGSMTSQSQTTLFHLIILAGCMFLVSFIFIFSLIRATIKEMHLCAGLIRQIEATKRSERKSYHKSIVFANMSHDLRTSLAAIIGLIDLCHYDASKGSELEANLFQMNTCASDLLDA